VPSFFRGISTFAKGIRAATGLKLTV